MDFDDLLSNCVYLLRGRPGRSAESINRFSHSARGRIPGHQPAQFYLVKLLGAAHGKVFVVGDDDQSIYAWRGAQVENILSFEKAFPGTKMFTLEQNYRSTGPILSFANAAIEPNTVRAEETALDGTARGRAGGGSPLPRRPARIGIGVRRRERMRAGRASRSGDIAVLFRTNAQSRLFEDSMRKRRIPYVLVGGTSFYERREIKDCLAYLRLCVNPKDDVSCQRIVNVPPRGMGDKAAGTA